MNRLIFRMSQRVGGDVLADERQSRHIQRVLALQPGDSIKVGQWGGFQGKARLLEFNEAGHARLTLESLEEPPAAKLPLTLLLAMPRPKVFRRVLQSITALGVEHLILLNAWRVEKSYWQTPWLNEDALQANIQLGLEQSGDTHPLKVSIQKRFKPFVEDELPSLLQAGSEAWVAHPHPMQNPHPHPVRTDKKKATVLAVGPEGGFIPYEVEKLISLGFTPLSLGPRVLKVDTAVAALIGHLML